MAIRFNLSRFFWWVLGEDNSANELRVYKYYSNWTYTENSILLLDEYFGGDWGMIEWDGANWWYRDFSHVYKFDVNWSSYGIEYLRYANSIVKKDSLFYKIDSRLMSGIINIYFSEDSIVYNISKNFQGNGYTYIQTDKSEEIGVISPVYNPNISLKLGDCLKVDFQTNSDSEIKLELINDGLEVKELVLNSGQIFLDENVEFDQIRFSSLFKEQDYLKIFDIKCYNVTNIVHYTEFYVDPFQSYSIYLTPTTYNLKILEGGEIKVDENIVILSFEDFYYTYYSPIQCHLTLNTTSGLQLNMSDFSIKVNRMLYGVGDEFWMVEPLFYADARSNITFSIYDQFNSYIDTFEIEASIEINLEIEVYSLTIKNMMKEDTTISINLTYFFEVLSYESINFILNKGNYQINYIDNLGDNLEFLIILEKDSIYLLNETIIPKSINITYIDVIDVGYNDIRWTSTGSIEYVRIELYNESSFVEIITLKIENNGYYSWYIPFNHTFDGDFYQIKIIDYYNDSIFAFSEHFSIEGQENTITSQEISGYSILLIGLAIGIIIIPLIIKLRKRNE